MVDKHIMRARSIDFGAFICLIAILLVSVFVVWVGDNIWKNLRCAGEPYREAALQALGSDPDCSAESCDIIAERSYAEKIRARAARQPDPCMRDAMLEWADFYERLPGKIESIAEEDRRAKALAGSARP